MPNVEEVAWVVVGGGALPFELLPPPPQARSTAARSRIAHEIERDNRDSGSKPVVHCMGPFTCLYELSVRRERYGARPVLSPPKIATKDLAG